MKELSEKELSKLDEARNFILQHPGWLMKDIIRHVKCSIRTAAFAKAELIKEGRIPPSRNSGTLSGRSKVKEIPPPTPPPEKTEVVSTKELFDMVKTANDPLLDIIEQTSDQFDDETRQKMLKQVKLIAFDGSTHPDTRLSAISVWAKLRDLEKAKDLGPGLPRTEKDIIERLSRLMLGVGIPLVLKALETAFPKDKLHETEQVTTLSGASETPNPV